MKQEAIGRNYYDIINEVTHMVTILNDNNKLYFVQCCNEINMFFHNRLMRDDNILCERTIHIYFKKLYIILFKSLHQINKCSKILINFNIRYLCILKKKHIKLMNYFCMNILISYFIK